MVHQEFVELVQSLNAEKPFEAAYGVVSQGKNIEGTIDRFADKNPLEILLIFMGEQNLRLVDLFRTFDKDQSGGLTRDEFIVGLQEINTPLSRSQLDELLDMLDKDGDGEIDLKEILNINREYRDIKMKANRFVQEEKMQKKLEKEGKKETELGAFTKEALAMKQRSQTMVETSVEAFGAGASNTLPPMTAPAASQPSGEEPLPTAASQSEFTVTKEEAEELNAQVKAIKTKGALSMWKNKALV
ncbi:uncharacterized protein [Watersipora subatra]|uniref:uncharacterized protein n=1 Tax=Watersipora subatra TaxID=2589382 RepID=UPI00355B4ED3